VSGRRISLKEKRELRKLSKEPRTRDVPHPFLLPDVRHEQK
jgi:hypothetical protein